MKRENTCEKGDKAGEEGKDHVMELQFCIIINTLPF